jgi:predicted DNA-binding protein (MmcQ/YjbR family)
MSIEDLRKICMDLPHTTEDIKWGNDLVFSVGAKMYAVFGLNGSPVSASFKVADEEFDELSRSTGFKPAPYLARYKWVHVEDVEMMNVKQWKSYLKNSYALVSAKLSPRIRKELGME